MVVKVLPVLLRLLQALLQLLMATTVPSQAVSNQATELHRLRDIPT